MNKIKRMQELAGVNEIKVTNNSALIELRELLARASEICSDNADLAENIDLIDMGDRLDQYVEELNAIDKFEVYDEDDDEG